MFTIKRIFFSLILLAPFNAIYALDAPAVIVPPGLSEGDTFYIAFPTADTIAATSTDRSTYDNFVNAQSDLSFKTKDIDGWSAMVSTTGDSIDCSNDYTSGISVYNTTGTKAFDSSFDLGYDQSGTAIGVNDSDKVWTGCNDDFSIATGNKLGDSSVRTGFSTATDSKWIDSTENEDNTLEYRIYAISPLLTVPAPSAPTAPTAITGTAGDSSAIIAFIAPADGGSAITGYTASCGGAGTDGTGSSSPLTVTGLTNGTAYNCSVTATNAIGTGDASEIVSVTPVIVDAHESDDTKETATIAPIGSLDVAERFHTFHTGTDEDWVKFYGNSNLTHPYTIETRNLEANADTDVYIYNAADTTTPLFSLENAGVEYIDFRPPSDGIYYIKVVNWVGAGNENGDTGIDTGYELLIYHAIQEFNGKIVGASKIKLKKIRFIVNIAIPQMWN